MPAKRKSNAHVADKAGKGSCAHCAAPKGSAKQSSAAAHPKKKKARAKKEDFAKNLWHKQYFSNCKRAKLFRAVVPIVGDSCNVLYAGSFIDINPSFVFPSVTYVDMDKNANRFFQDEKTVSALIAQHRPKTSRTKASFAFIHGDFRKPLNLTPGSFDLVVSLWAGLASADCVEYLKVGGHLLANASHGDVAWASLDQRYKLAAVVWNKSSGTPYRVDTKELDTFLVPKKKNIKLSKEDIRAAGRAIAYTRTPAFYLFRRVA